MLLHFAPQQLGKEDDGGNPFKSFMASDGKWNTYNTVQQPYMTDLGLRD